MKNTIVNESENSVASNENSNKEQTLTSQNSRYASVKKAFGRAGLAFLIFLLVVESVAVIAEIGTMFVASIVYFAESGIDLTNAEEIQEMIPNVAQKEIMLVQKFSWAFVALGTVVGLFVLKLMLKKIPSEPIEKKKLGGKKYFFFLIAGLCVTMIGTLIGNIESIFGLIGPADSAFTAQGLEGWLLVVYGVICAPIFEELVCRKILIDKLHGYGELPCAVLSSLLFALNHKNTAQFTLALFIGFILALVYIKTGKVLYCISIHAINNFLGMIPTALLLCGVEETVITAVSVAIVLAKLAIVVAGIILLIVKRKSDDLKLEKIDIKKGGKAIFGNFGFIAFTVITSALIIFSNISTLITNLNNGSGFVSFVGLIPLAAFAVLTVVSMIIAAKPAKTEKESDNIEFYI